jgi:hypothetical protein
MLCWPLVVQQRLCAYGAVQTFNQTKVSTKHSMQQAHAHHQAGVRPAGLLLLQVMCLVEMLPVVQVVIM